MYHDVMKKINDRLKTIQLKCELARARGENHPWLDDMEWLGMTVGKIQAASDAYVKTLDNLKDENTAESNSLLIENTILKKTLEFYATEKFYDMGSYTTQARLYVAGQPENVTVKGNPVMNDRGGRARKALGLV